MRRLYCSLQAVRMASLSAASLSAALPAPVSVQRHCNAFLVSPAADPAKRPTLILLNALGPLSAICSRWHHFDAVICADGGANRLYDSLHADHALRAQLVPSHIKGDLDSLRPEVAAFYQQRGCLVVRDEDQDCNDLEKCLQLVLEQQQQQLEGRREEAGAGGGAARGTREAEAAAGGDGEAAAGKEVVVFGAFGGRFDQQMASVNAALKFAHRGSTSTSTSTSSSSSSKGVPTPAAAAAAAAAAGGGGGSLPGISRVLLLGEGNAAVVLRRGRHILSLSSLEGPGCSLLPVGGPVEASTRGLQWELDHTALSFGGLVSTSNAATGREVEVVTSGDVVWCCDVAL